MLKVTRRKVALLVAAALTALTLAFGSPSTPVHAGCVPVSIPACPS
jgi:hypothetical protein